MFAYMLTLPLNTVLDRPMSGSRFITQQVMPFIHEQDANDWLRDIRSQHWGFYPRSTTKEEVCDVCGQWYTDRAYEQD